MSHDKNQKNLGFTIIELMLSMTFVSILLLAITMTVIEISNIYNRGLTLKEVNQSGRALVTDIKKTISVSQPFNIDDKLVTQDFGGGRLCLGRYSYVWNYGSSISKNDSTRLNMYEDSSETIRFVKVFDPSGNYCIDSTKKIVFKDAVELLSVGEHNLAVHGFEVNSVNSASDEKTNQRLYSVSFVVGTNNMDALTDESGELLCKAPNQPGADPAYCSVSRFDIVALAGNSVE